MERERESTDTFRNVLIYLDPFMLMLVHSLVETIDLLQATSVPVDQCWGVLRGPGYSGRGHQEVQTVEAWILRSRFSECRKGGFFNECL